MGDAGLTVAMQGNPRCRLRSVVIIHEHFRFQLAGGGMNLDSPPPKWMRALPRLHTQLPGFIGKGSLFEVLEILEELQTAGTEKYKSEM